MYHTMILEDVLDLINVMKTEKFGKRKSLIPFLENAAEKAMQFLESMCHPDGRIALFNDAAFGIET